MKDERKTKAQLISELVELRRRDTELETSEDRRKHAKGEMEKGTKDSAALYETMTSSSPVGIYIVQDRKFVYTNPQFQRDTGYSEDELIGKEPLSMVYPEDRETVRANAVRMLKGELSHPYEYRVINKNGETRDVIETVISIQYDGQQAAMSNYMDITELKRVEEALLKQTRDLSERIKELNCLYSISKLVEKPGISLEEILQGTVDLVPPGYQYPESACARVVLEDREFRTKNFQETVWKQASDITLHHEKVGTIEVYYVEEKPESDEGPFLKEERSLINGIAERIGRTIEQKGAEEALRQSEEKFRTILEGIDDGYFEIDLTGKMTFFNDAMLKISGYSRNEFMGMDNREYSTPEVAEKLYQVFNRIYRTGKSAEIMDYELIKKDGSTRVLELSTSLIQDQKDRPIGFRGIARDITERKQAEEALRRSEERYRTILESIEEGYFEVDLTGKFTFFNDSLCKIMGYPRDELMTMDNRDYTSAETAKKTLQAFNQIYRTGKPKKIIDHRIIAKDGSISFHEMSASILRDPEGQPIGFRGIARDVTERKRAEEAIKESEARYRALFDGALECIYVHDFEGKFIDANPAALKLLGYTKEEALTLNFASLLSPDQLGKAFKTIESLKKIGFQEDLTEYKLRRKDGQEVYIESSGTLLHRDGKPYAIQGVARDITARKWVESLEQAKAAAEAASQAKSEFLANMSHEIRTPLNGIIGMIELAFDTDLDDNQRNIFHTISAEADSLLGLITDILDFSKIEAGMLELEEIPFDLRVLVEDMANSIASRADQKGLEFISYLSPDVPAQLIGDPARLRQVLVNLADNALKFTHEGEVYIKGEMVEDLGDRVRLRFLVKDTGIGIPEDKQAVIFNGFTQADGSTTRQYGGTGLGTTISKQLTDLMAGEIGVESEVNKGSTFWFTVVLAKQTGQQAVLAREDVDLSDLRVLVVDDNQINRFILIKYLTSWGCRPVSVPGGKEALSVLGESVSSNDPFNLMLLDLQMPEMSGFDLAKEIRSREALKKVPILVLTSIGRIGDGKSCLDIGIEGYLTKPIKRDELRKAIESILGLAMAEEMKIAPKLVTRHSIAEESRKEVQILLAEDYPTNQQVAMRHLNRVGYQVDLAENGRGAVEACKRKHYDLILMDIEMPVMDGYEATKAIRNLEANLNKLTDKQGSARLERTPIIAMTAHALKDHREKCLAVGMDDYIAKPLKKKGLLAMVEKWVVPKMGSGGEFREEQSKDKNIEKDAPMNFEKAVEEFEGDKEFLIEVLDGFLEKARAQIGTIHQAISNGEAEVVGREAHSIKGGAANLTADDLSRIAFKLESIVKSGRLEGSLEILEKLQKEVSRLEDYARDH
ncbi:MAG: PAS domain S-box protein [Deltaproteobacteria bacterium]|nr:PAS domain S-box protein [Deltaproteobacteria bacterium]MBW2084472.1 PAS domain S-box protein [Deltaproteobacteria bacterium]